MVSYLHVTCLGIVLHLFLFICVYADYPNSTHLSMIGAWASLADKLPWQNSHYLTHVHHLTGPIPEYLDLPILLVARAGARLELFFLFCSD